MSAPALLLQIHGPVAVRTFWSVPGGACAVSCRYRVTSFEQFRSFALIGGVAAGVVAVLGDEFIADTRPDNPVTRVSATLSMPPKPLCVCTGMMCDTVYRDLM